MKNPILILFLLATSIAGIAQNPCGCTAVAGATETAQPTVLCNSSPANYLPVAGLNFGPTANQVRTPFATALFGHRIQYLYRNCEISACGSGSPLPIQEFGFHVTSVNPTTMNGFTIKMKNVATDVNWQPLNGPTSPWLSFGGGDFVPGATVVYSQNYTVSNTGWNMFTLNTPFLWDGVSSLLVEVCWENPSPGTGSSGVTYSQTGLQQSVATSSYTASSTSFTGAPGCNVPDVGNFNVVNLHPNRPIARFVLAPPTINLSAAVTQNPGCSSPLGQITVSSPTGSSLTYTLNGGNPQSSPVFNGLAPGNYTISAQGAPCPVQPLTLTIPAAPQGPQINAINTSAPNCTTLQADIQINAQGNAPLTYTLSPGNISNQTGFFPAMGPGNFTLTVTDANGCQKDTLFSTATQLSVPPAPQVNILPASCSAPGSASLANFNPALSYVFNPAGPAVATGGIITGMTPGISYSISADNGACPSPQSSPFDIDPQLNTPLVPLVSTLPASCSAPGSASLANFDPALSYDFNPAGPAVATGGIITGMTPGISYTISADNGACPSPQSPLFFIEAPDSFTISLNVIQPSCQNLTGEATVSVSPVGIYAFYWTQQTGISDSLTNNATNLSPGTYSVQVSLNGCIQDTSFLINEIDTIDSVSITLSNTSCGSPNGSLLVNFVTGGIAPYEYTLNTGVSGISGSFSGLPAGTYSLFVVDSLGCTYELENLIIIPSEGIEAVQWILTNPTCAESDGQLVIGNIEGGTEPYVYSLSGQPSNAQGVFANLNAGTYILQAQDALNCTFSDTLELVGNYEESDVIFPNIITPNGDGVNDEWKITAVCLEYFRTVIMNRWGSVVFTFDDPEDSWNGNTQGGSAVSEGVYFYVSELKFFSSEKKEFKGIIHVAR